jgi:hypothetical protein
LLLLLPLPLVADTVYTYTGNDFTYAEAPFTTSDFISGSFSVASPLSPNSFYYIGNFSSFQIDSFSFTDGLDTFTNQTPGVQLGDFEIQTDATGIITAWDIDVSATQNGVITALITNTSPGDTGLIEGSASADVDHDPGTWSGPPSAVPEPSSLILLATGALFLAGLAGRTLADAAL